MTDELDFRIQTLFRRVADAAPPAPDLDGWPTPSSSGGRGRIVAMSAAAGVAAIGLAGIVFVASRGGHSDEPPSGGSPASNAAAAGEIQVTVERMAYRQTAELTCANPIRSTGFNRAVIEAFADRNGQRWANRITYPDGSHREVIATGDAYYPHQIAEHGEQKGAVLGCHYDQDDLTLAAEPAQGSFYSLNPLDDIPTLDGESMVPGYRELGTLVTGEHHQLGGQMVDLWRQEIHGYWGFGGQRDVPGTQITEWFVEPATGEVLEWRFTTTIDEVGTATQSVTWLESGDISVPEDVFNDDGYRTLPGPERPQPQGSDDVSTVAPTAPLSSETVNSVCHTYTVRAGDYPAGIAESFGITYDELVAANPDLGDVSVGGVLAIPCP